MPKHKREANLNEFKQLFQKHLGMKILDELIEEKRLYSIFQDNLLLGSELAVQEQYLTQGDINKFLQSCPKGHYLIGFWGHGLNSYAFYYSRVDTWSKVFFRLPYGGVYMDNIKMAEQVRNFLTAFLAFEQTIINKVEQLVAVESMGIARYSIQYSDGTLIKHHESLFIEPDFIGNLVQV